MSQLFHPRSNTIARASLLAFALLVCALGGALFGFNRAPYRTRVGLAIEQPIPFSHHHHVAGLGIDCRYCHNAVETSASAGMPATGVCMNCHSQIWASSPMLAPVRDSYAQRIPLQWTRVHDLPDFVYFNHSIHVNKGVGCVSCHGRVDEMQLTAKAHSLSMSWCLDCHRAPDEQLRPREAVFNMAWQPPTDPGERRALAQSLLEQNRVRVQGLTDCTTCHR